MLDEGQAMSDNDTVFIEYQPIVRRGHFQVSQSLMEIAKQLGINVASICGGKGTGYPCG